jgi:hypothetical protein
MLSPPGVPHAALGRHGRARPRHKAPTSGRLRCPKPTAPVRTPRSTPPEAVARLTAVSGRLIAAPGLKPHATVAVRARRCHPSLGKRRRLSPPRAPITGRLTSLHFLRRSPPAAPPLSTLVPVRPVAICARAPPRRSSAMQAGRRTPSSRRRSRRFSPCAGR